MSISKLTGTLYSSYRFNQFLQELSKERSPQMQDESVRSLFNQIDSWLEEGMYDNYEYQRESDRINITFPILADDISIFLNGNNQIVARYREHALCVFFKVNSKWVSSTQGLYGHYHVDADSDSFFLTLQHLIHSVCRVPR